MTSRGAISANLIRFGGGFELDPRIYELRRDGRLLKLERIPMELLLLLLAQHGQLVSRDQIVERVWGKDVFLDTDNSINAAIRKIRQVLQDDPEHPRFVQTVTGRGYRFIAQVEEAISSPAIPVAVRAQGLGPENSVEAVSENTGEAMHPFRSIGWKLLALTGALVVTCVISGMIYVRNRHANRLTSQDTIVLGDFANSTGDPIFDDTLKTALTLTLRQSPFLNILSDSKVRKTLKLMTRDAAAALTPAVASEVCQRAGSKAYVSGAIGSLGTEYVVGLKAVNCGSGDVLAQEQVTAASKEQVLPALGHAASKLRGELGESLTTVQKFDVPMIEATTSSLEALRAFSEGTKVWNSKGESEALPYFKRAVELDPKFATAYASLAVVYQNLSSSGLAEESRSKAYELRERASERERLYILGQHYGEATGELEKAVPVYQQWQLEYPSDPTPRTNLGNIYLRLGRYEDGLVQHRNALSVEPNGVLIHENLGLTYVYMNRLDEAGAMVQRAFARNLDDAGLHLLLIQIAFMRDDSATIQQQLSWGMGKPGVEDFFLGGQSEMESSLGQMAKARESTRRATESALRSGSKETAAYWQVQGALHEAEVGNLQEAGKQADAALALTTDRDTQILVALALARAGKADRAKAIADQLDHARPLDLILQSYWLPSIRAMMQLTRRDSDGALRTLQVTVPQELGNPPPISTLYPVYLQGQALLSAHQGDAAAAEFQKVLAHRTFTPFVTTSLANLQLGRAYVVSGDLAKAKRAYEDFLTRWKDADSDVPVLKDAKAEYAKLK
jgi:eukaryotic-like serine/threonine-protein kinase